MQHRHACHSLVQHMCRQTWSCWMTHSVRWTHTWGMTSGSPSTRSSPPACSNPLHFVGTTPISVDCPHFFQAAFIPYPWPLYAQIWPCTPALSHVPCLRSLHMHMPMPCTFVPQSGRYVWGHTAILKGHTASVMHSLRVDIRVPLK